MIACVTALKLTELAESHAAKGLYAQFRHLQWQYQLHMQHFRQKKGAKLLITVLIRINEADGEGACRPGSS
ncbi:TPA: hypothetical protein L5T32_004151 [Pseudomonas aeruginosa]|nr:hypothetical protein [Pseudomonas aeruginosa]